ncbi:MAG: class I SAM-dependent methyltransferase [Candidatus Binatia bacterium]
MAEFAVPPCDEPFDFRRQASTYGQFRRDYSPALYDAIAARTGPGGGRLALDVGCGPGFVATALARRRWRAVGVDFSWPMLSQARAAHGELSLLQARGEAMPVGSGRAALVTCGTAFHWLQPLPALDEFARVLEPGGWVALFWRYAVAGQPHMQAIREGLGAIGVTLPDAYDELRVHAPRPFGGSVFVDPCEERIGTVLEFTAASFCGYVSTVEFLRRLSADRHAEFLDRLAERVAREFPVIHEANEEYLFLARRP